MSYDIAILPGDGIGPEVVAECVRVLERVVELSHGDVEFELEWFDAGAGTWQRTGAAISDETLLAAALRSGVDVRHDCGGHGRCGTCRLEILAGGDALSPTTKPEHRLLGDLLEAGWRLACQTRALGPVRVRVPRNVRAADGWDKKGDEESET